MQDDKRMPTRLPIPSRPAREIDAYASNGGGTGEAPALNVLASVWRRKAVVIACVTLALAAGGVYMLRAVPVFSSSSYIYVQQPSSKVASDSELTTAINSAQYLFTQCQVIQSSAILSKALDVPGVADAKVLRGLPNPVGYLHYALTATPTKQGDLIIVSMQSPNPQDAATVVNGVVQAYIDYQEKQHQNNAQAVVTVLQKEMDSRAADLDRENHRMLQLVRENPDLNLRSEKGGAGMVAERLMTLNGQLTDAQFRADDLRTGVAQAAATDPNDLSGMRALVDEYKLGDQMPPSSVPMNSQIFQQQNMRVQDLQDAHFGQGSEQMQRAVAARDRAQKDLASATQQAAAACLTALRTASAQADVRVKQLQTAIAAERTATQGLNAQEVEYAQLDQEATRNQHSMDLLDERIKTMQVSENYAPMTITVLETAKANPEPVSPVLSHILGLAGAAGLLVGLGAAILFDKMDQRLRSIEEIASLLDATILGVVPRIVRRILPGEVGREIQLRPRSGVAEAFRTIRTAIYFGGEERAVKTILITSPTPGDGKSTCISNLAIAVAQAGRRVLLIDADCRRPVQHKTFKVDETQGLTGVLTGRATLSDAVRPTEIDRLDLLQCGPLPHNPAELLDSQALLDLLGEAGRRYDQVLIDSPPVTLVSDARVLAASCDASVLVLRSERSTRRGATLAWSALSSVGANLLGVVVNDFARQKDGYGYTYYGYGRYGYAPAAPAELNGHGGEPAAANGKAGVVVAAAK